MLIAAIAAVLVLGRSLVALGAKPVTWDVDAAKRKADYVWLRGVGADCMDSTDAAMRLIGHAVAINPGDIDLQAQYALSQLSMSPELNDSMVEALYEPLIASYRQNPADYILGQQAATVAKALNRYSDQIEIFSTLDRLYPARTAPAASLANAYINRYVFSGDSTDFDRGIEILNRLEKGTGPDLGLTSQKVRAYSVRKDNDAITRELNALTEGRPNDPEAFLLTADIYGVLGMDSLVLPNIRKAVEIDPNNGQGLMKLAEYYRTVADSAAYDSTVFRVLASPDVEFPSKFTILRGYVSDMFKDSVQWPRIENLFSLMQQINPGESELHQLYAVFELGRDNLAASTEQFLIGLALEPTDSDMRLHAVQVLGFRAQSEKDSTVIKGLQDSIISVCRAGMEYSPDHLYFPIMAALTIDEQGDNKAAIDLMRGVDLGDMANPVAVSNFMMTLGDLYQRSSDLDSAFASYDRALSLDPTNDNAANNFAYFLAVEGRDLDKAERLSLMANNAKPDNPTYLDTYAWVLFKQGRFEQAKEEIDKAIFETVEMDPGTMIQADTTAVEPGDSIEVAEVAEEGPIAVPLFNKEDFYPDSTEVAADSIAEVAAVPVTLTPAEVREFVEMYSSDILDHAGDIYYMNGLKEDAHEFWKMAHELDPDNAEIARKARTGRLPADKQPKEAPKPAEALRPSE